MRKIILILTAIFLPLHSPAQETIDYNDKLLVKEISKVWGISSPQIRRHAGEGDDRRGKEKGDFFVITDSGNSSEIKYAWIGRVNSCRSGKCLPESVGDSEYFDYFILFDSNKSIRSVRVYNYQATHGAEVSTPGWLRQFVGYRGEKILRPGKEIDVISGATVSVDALVQDVQERMKMLLSLGS